MRVFSVHLSKQLTYFCGMRILNGLKFEKGNGLRWPENKGTPKQADRGDIKLIKLAYDVQENIIIFPDAYLEGTVESKEYEQYSTHITLIPGKGGHSMSRTINVFKKR